jgi:hypothetical protein
LVVGALVAGALASLVNGKAISAGFLLLDVPLSVLSALLVAEAFGRGALAAVAILDQCHRVASGARGAGEVGLRIRRVHMRALLKGPRL